MSDATAEAFNAAGGRVDLEALLRAFEDDRELFRPPELIARCRIRKEFERRHPAGPFTR